MAARQTTRFDAGARSVPLPDGEVYTPAELAKCWKFSENTIRYIFENQDGVFRLGKRRYVTLRIPRDVAERVWRERSR